MTTVSDEPTLKRWYQGELVREKIQRETIERAKEEHLQQRAKELYREILPALLQNPAIFHASREEGKNFVEKCIDMAKCYAIEAARAEKEVGK